MTFILMEATAWAMHKYVMHGFGWYLHKDHHQPNKGSFERNDLFFLVFAIPSIFLIVYGSEFNNSLLISIGLGIACYGIAYSLVHEIFIHQRLPILKRTNNAYLRAIRKAHKVHHKQLEKEHGSCFGMLVVPLKYFREAKNRNDS